jgi:ferrous iron transport protein A
MSVLAQTANPWGENAGERPSSLGHAERGFRGRIHAIETAGRSHSLSEGELEQRLLELGFTEGALIEILHEGFFGRDPIAVRVNDSTIALRRREAMAILVV